MCRLKLKPPDTEPIIVWLYDFHNRAFIHCGIKENGLHNEANK